MFTGIVTGQGLITKIKPSHAGIRIQVRHQGWGRNIQIGDSVAVNGCCLTVISNRRSTFEFDLLGETWQQTSFKHGHLPEKVNLERSLCYGESMGGHLVSGHIDGVGQISSRLQKKSDVYIEIKPPRSFMKYLAVKGCIAIDGVSLTVAIVKPSSFGVWFIPHTLKLTTLGWKQKGDFVNLESDILAKYVLKALGKS